MELTLGAGLIVAGALALVQSLASPTPGMPGLPRFGDGPERFRRQRTARVGLVVGTISSLLGAGLTLATGPVWPAIGAVIAVAIVDWVALARLVARDYCQLLLMLESFRSIPKNPPSNWGAYVGLTAWVAGNEMQGSWELDEAIRRARERSSFRRALIHPVGYRDGL